MVGDHGRGTQFGKDVRFVWCGLRHGCISFVAPTLFDVGEWRIIRLRESRLGFSLFP
jgi:hypothetical protein